MLGCGIINLGLTYLNRTRSNTGIRSALEDYLQLLYYIHNSLPCPACPSLQYSHVKENQINKSCFCFSEFKQINLPIFFFILFFKDLRLKIVPKWFKVCTFLVSQSSFRRQEKAPLRLWLGSALHLYTFFRLYRWTGWDKCWTFLLLLAVTVSFWQMTPHPPAHNVSGGAQGWAIASAATGSTRPSSSSLLFRRTWPPSLVPLLTRVAVAVTWAWPWPSWGRDWRVLCRAGGRERWLFRGAAAGKPGAPRCGACTGPTALGFG